MTATATAPVRESAITLPTFDLSYVIEQMSKKSKFAEWTPERFRKAQEEYRQFVALCRAFPERSLGISPDADEIWHRHILNTRRYIADCNTYFGEYFHHTPVCDKSENFEAQQETNKLSLEIFGVSRLPSSSMTCVGTGCMNNG